MKHEKITVTHTCDVCGNVCEPIGTLKIPFSHYMDLRNEIHIRISAYIPYGTADGDVCGDCFFKHIKRWLEEVKEE